MIISNKKITLEEKLKQDKIQLAEQALSTAKTALDNLEALNAEGALGPKDLVAVFNSAVKAHRDLVKDIRSMDDVEAPAEAELAQAYTSAVDDLLNSFNSNY